MRSAAVRSPAYAAALVLAVTFALSLRPTLAQSAQSAYAKPRLPPGVDPGGIAIGVITTGIDYTRADVSRCLARDGEGELIGWDMVDGDRLPFRASVVSSSGSAAAPMGRGSDDGHLVGALCNGSVRLVPVRVDPTVPTSVARALAFLAATPARIVVLPAAAQPNDWAPLRQAAAAFRQLVVVAASRDTAAEGVANIVGIEDADGFRSVLRLVTCTPMASLAAMDGATLAAQLRQPDVGCGP